MSRRHPSGAYPRVPTVNADIDSKANGGPENETCRCSSRNTDPASLCPAFMLHGSYSSGCPMILIPGVCHEEQLSNRRVRSLSVWSARLWAAALFTGAKEESMVLSAHAWLRGICHSPAIALLRLLICLNDLYLIKGHLISNTSVRWIAAPDIDEVVSFRQTVYGRRLRS